MLKLTLISLLCCFYSASMASPNINFTHYTIKDGLLNSTVYYAMQDSKGFIWFCTETGVNRYDGRKFESFTIKDGLADNENFKCYEDTRGRIWFLSYNGQLSYYCNGKIYNKHNTPKLAYKNNGTFLLDCVEDKNGIIWFNTSLSDVLKVTDSAVQLIPSPVPEKQHNSNYFSSKLFTKDKTAKKLTLIGNNIYETDLLTMKLSFIDSLSHVLNAPKFEPEINKNQHWEYFFTAGTLIKFDKNSFELLDRTILKMETRVMSFLAEDSTWWVGSDGEGVARVIYDGKNKLKVDYFLHGHSITYILKDAEGNLWFTTHGNGVFLLKNNTSKITVLSSEPAYSIASLQFEGQRYLFTGGEHGNVAIYAGSDLIQTINISTNKLNRVREIVQVDKTKVAFFSDGPMMYIYDMETHVGTASINYQCYKAGTIDSSGKIWACTQEGIMQLKNNELHITKNTGELVKIAAFTASSDSLFYVGTSNKLYKITNGNHSKVLVDDTILKTGISDLKINGGILWVATHGNGIFLIKNDTVIKHITTENGLVGDVCQKLYDDRKKFMWLGTNNGISIINRDNGGIFYNISSSGGLISDDVKNISTYNDSIFIATSAGVNIFKLGDLIYSTPPPHVCVTGLRKGNQQITDPPDTVSFDFFKGFINIHFTALTFVAPLDNKYEYKFEYDKEWQRTQVTDISLFGLPPGIHRLLLRAKKYNSGWSAPVIFTLNVQPLWYQTIWFSCFTGCVLLSLLYFLFTRRIKYLRQRTEQQNSYEKRIIELESKSLAYQMNPHFIFNSLNTVQQFILAKDEKQGLDYLSEFSMLMRQILENSKKTSILLSEEVDFLSRYLELEQIRYSNQFTYSIRLDSTLQNEDIKIPPMLFQPLLENAVKHGISGVDDGHITVDLKVINDDLVGTVEDNGRGMYYEQSAFTSTIRKVSTALKVLEERVKLIKNADGKSGSFRIIDKSLINSKGTIIEIIIPINIRL